MKRVGKYCILSVIFILFFVLSIGFISSESINDALHLNVQVEDSGVIKTGTFDFAFNISTTSDCSNVLYSNSATLTTDSRGIISYYLNNTNLNYTEQYWICEYRNGVLKSGERIGNVPYSFYAQNTSAEGIIADSNLDLSGKNITSNWFKGLFNWISLNNWIIFDGKNATFNTSNLDTSYYNASLVSTIAGTPQGTGTEINYKYDEISYNVTEVASNPGMDLRVNFTGVSNTNELLIRYRTTSSKIAYIQLWDYGKSTWEDYGSLSTSIQFSKKDLGIDDASDHIQGGILQFRIYIDGIGNPSNKWEFDMITISSGYAPIPGQEIDPISWHKDQNIETGGYNITIGTILDSISTDSLLTIGGNIFFGGSIFQTGGMNILNQIIHKGVTENFAGNNGLGQGSETWNLWLNDSSSWETIYTYYGAFGDYQFSGGVWTGKYIYMIPSYSDQIVKVNPATNKFTNISFDNLDYAYYGGCYDGRNVWMAQAASPNILKLDTTDDSITYISYNKSFNYLDGVKFSGCAFIRDKVFFIPEENDYLISVNVKNNSLTEYTNVNISDTYGDIAFNGGIVFGDKIWMIPFKSPSVVAFNPDTMSLENYSHGHNVTAYVGGCSDGERIWLAPAKSTTIDALNPATGVFTNYSYDRELIPPGTSATTGCSFDGVSVWFSPTALEYGIKLDPNTGNYSKYYFNFEDGGYRGVVFTGKHLFFIPFAAQNITKIRPPEFGDDSIYTTDLNVKNANVRSLQIEGLPGNQLSIGSSLWSGNNWSIYHNSADATDDYGLVFKQGSITAMTLTNKSLTAQKSLILPSIKSVAASSDNVDVTGISMIYFSTTGGDVRIGGLSNGVTGQTIMFIKANLANNLIIENDEGTGDQEIVCPNYADVTFTTYGGGILYCTGTQWRLVSYSNS